MFGTVSEGRTEEDASVDATAAVAAGAFGATGPAPVVIQVSESLMAFVNSDGTLPHWPVRIAFGTVVSILYQMV